MSEQRIAGKELDALVAVRVMGVSLDMPRERALSMIGATFTRETGRVFEVDYGDGREYLPMPAGDSLPSFPSDDNFNQRYFRYVAEQGIAAGGKRAEMIERAVAECRRPTEKYSTDIAAAWLVVTKMRGDGFQVIVIETPNANATCEIAEPAWSGSECESAESAPLAICLAALAAVAARESAATD